MAQSRQELSRRARNARLGVMLVVLGLAGCASTGSLRGTRDDLSALSDISGAGAYLAATVAGSQRDAKAASELYAEALRADPDNAVILERAFLLRISAGEIGEASVLARRILAQEPDSPVARVVLAIEALKARRHGEAADLIGTTAKEPGSDIVWMSIRAWALAGEGKTDEALLILRSRAARENAGAFGQFVEAQILEFAGRAGEAEQLYSAATIASRGQSVRVVEAYGRFLERQGRREDAKRLYGAFLEAEISHPIINAAYLRAAAPRAAPVAALATTPAEGVAEAIFGISGALAGEGGIDIAIIYAQMSLYLRPDFPVARALLGDLYERTERYDLALATFESIPAKSEIGPMARVRVARNLSRLERNDEGIRLLERALKRGGADLDIFVALGDLYRVASRWDDATRAYDGAIGLIGTVRRDQWQLLYAKGIALERAGRWGEAEPLFRQALALEPDQPQVLNYLGYSWIDRGENLKEGLEMISKAVNQRPNDGYIVDSLGWAHFRLGEYESAVFYLERAVELKPDDPTINDHLGDAYWMVGRRLEARFQWTHALQNNPSAEEKTRIEAKLRDGLGGGRSISNGS